MDPIDLTNQQICDMTVNNLTYNLSLLRQGRLPKSYISSPLIQYYYKPDGTFVNFRDAYIKQCGFALLAEDWIKPLARWIGSRPCLEVMAGTGSLTYFLKQQRVRIKATDNYSWSNKFLEQYIEIESIDAVDAVTKYGKKVKFIIMSWPYMDDTAYRVLMRMREVNKDCRLIYIGEYWGGCTADDKFFDAVEDCEVKGFYDVVSKYRHWDCIHDSVYLYK